MSGGARFPAWHSLAHRTDAGFLPADVFLLVQAQEQHRAESPGPVLFYDTREAAVTSLNRSAVAYGRSLVPWLSDTPAETP